MKRFPFYFLLVLIFVPIVVWGISETKPQIRPQIPSANRNSGKIFLERAENLRKGSQDSFLVVVGNVVFTRLGMTMRCDSAHYYPSTESLDAFGNVSMEQGDTLFVYADEMDYDGNSEIAALFAEDGKKIRMINRDVTLETNIFYYDLGIELGYYDDGGKLYDKLNTLTSMRGEYNPNTKEANFYDLVHLLSEREKDTLNIWSDSLYYNTKTHISELRSPSKIVNWRATIYTDNGIYATDSGNAELYNRSVVVTPQGRRLTADTIFYNRGTGIGEAFGSMILSDSAKQASIFGDYGFYNEIEDSSHVQGHAMISILQNNSEDTLYVHGKYIETIRCIDSVFVKADSVLGIEEHSMVDTTHVAIVFPRVRFYRADMQGICDSMRFTEKDSTLRMFVHPVLWNEDRQVFGNIVEILMNDSTVEMATLPDQGFLTQHLEGDHYNQMSGNEMIAHFENGNLRRMNINGTVQIIMYPEEADSTINKMVNAQSSYLEAWFDGQTTERVKMWPETTGVTTPLFMARRSNFFLPKFEWYENLRPSSKDDIFIIPKEMDELMDSPIKASRR